MLTHPFVIRENTHIKFIKKGENHIRSNVEYDDLPLMKLETILDISEIIGTFDLQEIKDLVERQVDTTEGLITSNYFNPIYTRYRNIRDTEEGLAPEVLDEVDDQFTKICRLFIDSYCQKFQLEFNDDWLEENTEQLPAIVFALYNFFIRDLRSNLQEVLIAYINQHKKELFALFEDRKNKKDSATLVNKRKFPVDLAVILANIYDVSAWILSQISEEEFMNLMNEDYIELSVIRKLMDEGWLSGQFVEIFHEIYESNIGVKGEVCFDVLVSFNVIEGKDSSDDSYGN